MGNGARTKMQINTFPPHSINNVKGSAFADIFNINCQLWCHIYTTLGSIAAKACTTQQTDASCWTSLFNLKNCKTLVMTHCDDWHRSWGFCLSSSGLGLFPSPCVLTTSRHRCLAPSTLAGRSQMRNDIVLPACVSWQEDGDEMIKHSCAGQQIQATYILKSSSSSSSNVLTSCSGRDTMGS